MAAAGFVLSEGLLRFVRGHELRQVLLTLGVAFVINDMALVIWGGDSFTVPIPETLRGAVQLFGVYYPKYRLFVLVAGCLIFVGLWLLLQRTRLGALIRAGVDDAEMVEASGINIRRVFLLTFLLGSALAGFGGPDGRRVSLALSVGRCGNSRVQSRRRHHRRPRQPRRRRGREPAGRLAQHLRPGDVSGARLFRDLRTDGGAAGVPPARPVRTGHLTWHRPASRSIFPLDGFAPRAKGCASAVDDRRRDVARRCRTAARPVDLPDRACDRGADLRHPRHVDRSPGGLRRPHLARARCDLRRFDLCGGLRERAGRLPAARSPLRSGLLAATAVAAIFALLAVRTSGVYFLLLTLALGMIVWGICLRWTEVTGGENGLRGDIRPAILVPHRNFYWLVLAVAAPLSFAMWRFVRSPFGLTLRGIRDSESRMQSLGYHVPLHLFIGFTVSGFFAGIAGAFYAFFNNFVSPSTVALAQSVEGLLMAIVGGVGTLFGAFVGAATIIVLENTVSAYTERWPTVLGLTFIVVMIFAPRASSERSESFLHGAGVAGQAPGIVQPERASP